LESIFTEKNLADCVKECAERKIKISQIGAILREHHPFGSVPVVVQSEVHINYVLFTVLCQSSAKYFEMIIEHEALATVNCSQIEGQIRDRVNICLGEKSKVV